MSINGVVQKKNTGYRTSRATHFGNVSQNSFSNELNSAMKTTSLDDIFNRASKKYGVSANLLKAVAKAESNFNVNAGAGKPGKPKGIMQLMPATSRELGVTNPLDAEQNIMGGAKLLSKFINKYNGRVDLALAAYNAGPGNVAKYGGIPPFKETQNYVKKISGYIKGDVTIDASKNKYTSSASNEIINNTPVSYDYSSLLNYSPKNMEELLLMSIMQNEMHKTLMLGLDNDSYIL